MHGGDDPSRGRQRQNGAQRATGDDRGRRDREQQDRRPAALPESRARPRKQQHRRQEQGGQISGHEISVAELGSADRRIFAGDVRRRQAGDLHQGDRRHDRGARDQGPKQAAPPPRIPGHQGGFDRDHQPAGDQYQHPGGQQAIRRQTHRIQQDEERQQDDGKQPEGSQARDAPVAAPRRNGADHQKGRGPQAQDQVLGGRGTGDARPTGQGQEYEQERQQAILAHPTSPGSSCASRRSARRRSTASRNTCRWRRRGPGRRGPAIRRRSFRPAARRPRPGCARAGPAG